MKVESPDLAGGAGAGDGALSGLDDWAVDHLAVEGEGAAAALLGLGGCLKDTLGLSDLFVAGREGLLDGLDLVGVDDLLADKAHVRSLLRFLAEVVEVTKVDVE